MEMSQELKPYARKPCRRCGGQEYCHLDCGDKVQAAAPAASPAPISDDEIWRLIDKHCDLEFDSPPQFRARGTSLVAMIREALLAQPAASQAVPADKG
jgi:hypothetical protein